jgi:hypothetical protein
MRVIVRELLSHNDNDPAHSEVYQLGSLMRVPFREGRYGEGVKICLDAVIQKLSMKFSCG